MLLQAGVPHLAKLIAYVRNRMAWRNGALFLSNVSSAKMEADLSGPPFDFALRSAQLLNVLFVTFTFMVPMPLMAVAGFVAFAAAFWADKLFMTRLHRRPPFTTTALISAVVDMVSAAAILHVGLGAWVVGTMDSLDK